MPTDDSDFLLDEGGSHGCKGSSCGACILIGTQVGLSEKHPMVESSFSYIFLIFHSPFWYVPIFTCARGRDKESNHQLGANNLQQEAWWSTAETQNRAILLFSLSTDHMLPLLRAIWAFFWTPRWPRPRWLNASWHTIRLSWPWQTSPLGEKRWLFWKGCSSRHLVENRGLWFDSDGTSDIIMIIMPSECTLSFYPAWILMKFGSDQFDEIDPVQMAWWWSFVRPMVFRCALGNCNPIWRHIFAAWAPCEKQSSGSWRFTG